MNSKKSLRLGDIYLVRKSKSKAILAAVDKFGDSLDEIFADENEIIIKKIVYPKTIDKSFSIYKLSYILDDYYNYKYKPHTNRKDENILISSAILADWQKKLNDKNIQENIDIFFRYLQIKENIRFEEKERVKAILLNSLSLEEFIESFNQSEPGKN